MKKKNILWFASGLILTVILMWPLFVAPYFSMQTDVQAIRLYEMNLCIKDGQIPCRWVPDLGGGFGYPLFNYYAPLAYYGGELFYFLSDNLLFSTKVMFGLAFLGSYIFMYLLGRKLWGDLGGVVSGVFYSFAPYHASVFFVRGALGEMWALMFFPAIFWAILRLKESVRIVNVLLLSSFIAGLALSHNLSLMIFLPVFLAFALLLFWQKRSIKFLQYFAVAGVLGLLLSSFYLLPMVAEKNLVHVDSIIQGNSSYTEQFKSLYQLFLNYTWGYGNPVRQVPGGPQDTMSYQVGWVILLGWILSLVSAKLLWKKNRAGSYLILFCSALSAASIFMINPRSEFIWRLIDPLKYLQYPWRFLLLVTFAISTISGSVLLVLPAKWRVFTAASLILLMSLSTVFYFQPEKFIYLTDQEFLSGTSWNNQIQNSINDFLPNSAQEAPTAPHPERYQVIVGDTTVKNYQEGTDWFKFDTQTSSHTILQLSKYYFPDWKVYVDGKEVKVDYKNNHLGLLNVILGRGPHHIEGYLYDTQVRSWGNLLTAFGLLAFLFLLSTRIPLVRRSLFYYAKGLYR